MKSNIKGRNLAATTLIKAQEVSGISPAESTECRYEVWSQIISNDGTHDMWVIEYAANKPPRIRSLKTACAFNKLRAAVGAPIEYGVGDTFNTAEHAIAAVLSETEGGAE